MSKIDRWQLSSQADLVLQIRELAPWHMGIQITEDLNTGMVISDDGEIPLRDKHQNQGISLLQLRDYFLQLIDIVFPNGMQGKTFLDCACNAGGYGFWMAERGINYGFGFDVREHWIRQARFVQENRTIASTEQLEYVVSDLYDLPKFRLAPFDVTMFKGIFYHLPDPVNGLKIAADLTKELLILNTSIVWNGEDGHLKLSMKSREALMSGVYGLCWYPTGPGVLATILRWLDFKQIKLIQKFQVKDAPQLGRVEIYASRSEGLLDQLPGEYI